MSELQVSNPGVLLPDLPGVVHGIKSKDPWTVQCDDCLTCWSGGWALKVVKQAIFNQYSGLNGLRLCDECWAKRGWENSATKGWVFTEVRGCHV